MLCQATCTPSLTQCVPTAVVTRERSHAQQLPPAQRQELAVQVLAGARPVAHLARALQVSRKFLYQQAHTAQDALNQVFDPPPKNPDVLFYLPVTKAWLHQLVLALVLIGHCSYRGVIALLRDLLDWPLSLGSVHQIVRAAVAPAQKVNQQYNLAHIRIGAHDEIFQAGHPVLVGVDTASSFCYLLNREDQRDADTWGLHLLELHDRGLAPDAIVADAGSGLRAGQKLALPAVPCRGDVFHVFMELTQVERFLENAAYKAIAAHQKRFGRLVRGKWRGVWGAIADAELSRLAAASDRAVARYDEVALLLGWLRGDILAVAGPSYAVRCQLYDFVVDELQARVAGCAHRLGPLCRLLRNQREDVLAFARDLDERLDRLAGQFQVASEVLRRLLVAQARSERDGRRWSEFATLREQLHGQFHAVSTAVAAVGKATVRSSSLVENLNSRLRNYFFLRRQLGPEYLRLLQFFLNHRRLERSECPERVGKSPAQLLTGQEHRHWLELLGYTRFQRS